MSGRHTAHDVATVEWWVSPFDRRAHAYRARGEVYKTVSGTGGNHERRGPVGGHHDDLVITSLAAAGGHVRHAGGAVLLDLRVTPRWDTTWR